MINIKYADTWSGSTGQMDIDIIQFIENMKMTDVTFLCKKVIGIAWDRWEISNQIIEICKNKIDMEKHQLQNMVDKGGLPKYMLNDQVRLIKRYQRCIDLLEQYTE